MKTISKNRKKQEYSTSLKIVIECRSEVGNEFQRKLHNENIILVA